MKIELYKNSNIINKDSDSSNLVFKSSNILVYCNDDYFEFKNTNGDTYIIIGKIFGIYNGIDLNKFDNEKQLKNSLSNYSVENIKSKFDGRYILLKITDNNKCFLTTDCFGKIDVYYYENNNKIIISSDLSNFNLDKIKSKYDYFSVAHSLYIYGYRPPKKHTLYKDIYRLGVDEYLKWENDQFDIVKTNVNYLKNNENFTEKDLNKYYEIWIDAIEKKSSENGNLVFLTSGWDSSSLLAGLVHLKGKKKVEALLGQFYFSERSGLGNKYEVDRAKNICEYFDVKFHMTKIDHVNRGQELYEKWKDYQKNNMFSGLSFYLWSILAEYVEVNFSDYSIFCGEISDGIHNFGFSQHTTILNHPVLEFREYSDKMASYLFGKNFFKNIINKNEKNDVVFDLLKNIKRNDIFDSIKYEEKSIFLAFLKSMFGREVRIPYYSIENSKIFTKKGMELYDYELKKNYFDEILNSFDIEKIYAYYSYLYNSFHWQGGTVITLGYLLQKKKLDLHLPFYDLRIHEFLSQVPENFGRGLEIIPTKYPLKWILNNKIKYPHHLQVGPHSYIYDVDPNFSFPGEFIYASSYTPIIKNIFKNKAHEEILDGEYFNLEYFNKIIKNYLNGDEVLEERNDLASLAYLSLAGWY